MPVEQLWFEYPMAWGNRLVIVALLIAVPVSWYLMNQWLPDFAYRMDVEWWMFVAAGCMAMVIALLN